MEEFREQVNEDEFDSYYKSIIERLPQLEPCEVTLCGFTLEVSQQNCVAYVNECDESFNGVAVENPETGDWIWVSGTESVDYVKNHAELRSTYYPEPVAVRCTIQAELQMLNGSDPEDFAA